EAAMDTGEFRNSEFPGPFRALELLRFGTTPRVIAAAISCPPDSGGQSCFLKMNHFIGRSLRSPSAVCNGGGFVRPIHRACFPVLPPTLRRPFQPEDNIPMPPARLFPGRQAPAEISRNPPFRRLNLQRTANRSFHFRDRW